LGPRKNPLIRCCPLCRGAGHASDGELCPICSGDGHLAKYNPYLLFRRSPWIRGLLAAAIEVSGAEFGNVQLFDSKSESLKIVAQQGFKRDFLSFFDQVHDGATACGAAMKERSRILVSDVGSDPIFFGKEPGEVMLRAGVNAVQSTPLIAPSGNVIGIVSTHYHRPRTFSTRLLKEVDAVCANFTREIREAHNGSKRSGRALKLNFADSQQRRRAEDNEAT